MTSGKSITGRATLVGILASLLPLYGIAFSQESAQSVPAAGVATPDSRLACPPDAKVDEDVKLIRAAYEAAYDSAKDTGEPDSLIQQLVGLSNQTPDPAKKYALLLEAEAVATQYENYATALDLLAKRAEKFQIDGLKLKGQLLKRLAGPKVAADLVLFDQATDTALQAMQAERFDVAAETASLALSVARAVDREQKVEARKRGRPVGKAGKAEAGPMPVGPALVKKATALQSQVTAAQKLFAEYGEALADIKSQPDDAAANSVVAQYLCFVRGDWQRGLPALAKSDIDRLKTVAAAEISLLNAENRDTKQVFDLAGAWWAASDSKDLTDDQQAAVKDHAAGFYAEVADSLSDLLEKQLAKSRLRGLETQAPSRRNQRTVFDFSRPNQLDKFTVGGVMRETPKGLEFPGSGSSWVDSRQSFAGPLEAAFVASTFPDINLDCYVGIFSSQPLTSFGQSGIHLHWGCFGNTRTLLYVFGKIREIRHRPIEAGRDYTITLRVDKDRQLTVLIDELIIHQEVLPSDIKLVGSIRCGGGVGHVLHRSATVVTGQVTNSGTQPDPGRLMGFRESIGKTIAFNVFGAANGGSVWGSNPYTADSQLARAAVHAGVVRPGEAGVINVTILPGQQSYEGTARNGVTTGRWGSFGLSYRIELDAASRTIASGAVERDLKFTVGPEGVTITGYAGKASVVTIPDTIQGRPVVGIGSDAFSRRAGIEAITLPKTVANIGNMTFYKCVDLKSVNMPESLTTIGFNAFEFCSSLGDVSIPARVAKIGAVCFVNCPNTKAISVDDANPDYASVDGILYDKEVRTLITCPAGKRGEVRIPPSVTTILGWSFLGCDKLKRIVIPNTVTDIQDNAFAGCDAQRIVLGK
jgi:hypothetical protein